MSVETRPATSRKTVRVLIVDDSAAVRRVLSEIIESDPKLAVMATASDPYVAAKRISKEVPDVIFLDIEMPRMDGLTFLRKIMAQRPIPVVICSGHTEEGSDTFLQALEAGAIDVITKPRVDTAHALKEARVHICDVARAAANARVGGARPLPAAVSVERKLTADVVIPPPVAMKKRVLTAPVVCIGSSTGGTEALRIVLTALPPNVPGVVIVQHMPENFTAAFARRLDGVCAVKVKEASDGDDVLPGQVLIAPGNRHMLLERIGKHYQVAIKDGPLVSRHRPSVDVLFRSAAQNAGPNATGFILTGMGDDGAHGLLEMRNAGARTFAQDEESCVVFGMPKEAIQCGAVEQVIPLSQVAEEVAGVARAKAAVAS